MIGAFVAVITCMILNTLIPNLCYTEEAWTSFGQALVFGLTIFNWGFILYWFAPSKRKERTEKKVKKAELKELRELTPEQWEKKIALENAVKEKAEAVSKSVKDTETFLKGEKYDKLNIKYAELQSTCSFLENKIKEKEKELKDIYNTEPYKLGIQAIERKKMTANLKKFILERDDYTCQACGASLHNDFNLKLEVDHIVPISKGGKTDPSNLQTLCRKCNRSKGAKPMEVFVGGK